MDDDPEQTVHSSPIDQITSTVCAYVRSTSKRTFVAIPLVVLAEQAISRRRLRAAGLPFMAWGYLQYLRVGHYRSRLGGGGGFSGPPPDRIVTSGIYGFTRNPMYSGHLIFLGGLTLSTGSPFALAIALGMFPWFRNRIIKDEQRLIDKFGDEYLNYLSTVGRWGPWTTTGLAVSTISPTTAEAE